MDNRDLLAACGWLPENHTLPDSQAEQEVNINEVTVCTDLSISDSYMPTSGLYSCMGSYRVYKLHLSYGCHASTVPDVFTA